MTAPVLTEDEWTAARLAAGEQVPDASDAARVMARAALAATNRQYMDDLADHVAAGYIPSGRSGPRASDFGGCGRAVWYRESPPDGYEPAAVDTRRATLGSIIHQAAEQARRARYPWRRYEFEVQIPGLDKPGRIDEYDPVLAEVTDAKTAGAYKWEVYGTSGPPEEAWGQVNLYALALDEMGYPVRTVRIVAINRDTGYEEHFRDEYDPVLARAALDELVALATMLDLGVVPVREGTGPGSFPCSWCEARLHCWNVTLAAAAGRSPESYTVLGAEPADPIIEWAAREAHTAAQAVTAAEKAKKAAAKLLAGIRPGTYGDMVITERRRRMPNWKAAYLRLLRLYRLPLAHRPAVERVEEPLYRWDRWVEAKPVRAAAAKRPPRKKKTAGADAEPA